MTLENPHATACNEMYVFFWQVLGKLATMCVYFWKLECSTFLWTGSALLMSLINVSPTIYRIIHQKYGYHLAPTAHPNKFFGPILFLPKIVHNFVNHHLSLFAFSNLVSLINEIPCQFSWKATIDSRFFFFFFSNSTWSSFWQGI